MLTYAALCVRRSQTGHRRSSWSTVATTRVLLRAPVVRTHECSIGMIYPSLRCGSLISSLLNAVSPTARRRCRTRARSVPHAALLIVPLVAKHQKIFIAIRCLLLNSTRFWRAFYRIGSHAAPFNRKCRFWKKLSMFLT